MTLNEIITECIGCKKIKTKDLLWVPQTHLPEYQLYKQLHLISHGYCPPCADDGREHMSNSLWFLVCLVVVFGMAGMYFLGVEHANHKLACYYQKGDVVNFPYCDIYGCIAMNLMNSTIPYSCEGRR